MNDWGAGLVDGRGAGAALRWFELDSGESIELAVPQAPWSIDGVAASNEWLVWVEQDDPERDDPLRPVDWRIWAYEFATGESTLVREASELTPLAPGVEVVGNRLFFDVYRGLEARTFDLFAHDLSSGATTTLREDVAAAQIAWDGERALVDVTESVTGPGESVFDIYVIDKGDLVPVTDTGHSGGAEYHDGVLLWREPSTNADDSVGPDSIWVRPWPSAGEPRVLAVQQYSNVRLGAGFAVDWSYGQDGPMSPVVYPIDPGAEPYRLGNPVGTEMVWSPEAHGSVVAWLVEDAERGGFTLVAETLT